MVDLVIVLNVIDIVDLVIDLATLSPTSSIRVTDPVTYIVDPVTDIVDLVIDQVIDIIEHGHVHRRPGDRPGIDIVEPVTDVV